MSGIFYSFYNGIHGTLYGYPFLMDFHCTKTLLTWDIVYNCQYSPAHFESEVMETLLEHRQVSEFLIHLVTRTSTLSIGFNGDMLYKSID